MRMPVSQDEVYVAVLIKRPPSHGAPPPDAPGIAQFLADSLTDHGMAHQRYSGGRSYPVAKAPAVSATFFNRLSFGLGALCLVGAGYFLCLAIAGIP